ncbi:uncharacterized protein LOC119489294 [Tachysurus ichikawai]
MKVTSERDSISKRELLSLLGHFNFAMRIIPQGRSFISRLLDISKSAENLHDSITLNAGCKSELHFWSLLCAGWNGISFFYNDAVETSVTLKFFTDAAPSRGFGGLFNNQWFTSSWPKELSTLPPNALSTALLELYPIVVACILWGKLWSRKQILVFCDNEATVHIINKGCSSVPFINTFLRRLTWTCVTCNFLLRSAHIPGLDNKIADCLSRFKFQEFRAVPRRLSFRPTLPSICPDHPRLSNPTSPQLRICSLLEHPSIRLLLNGIRKGTPKGADKRLPLTIPLVKKLVTKLRQGCFSPYQYLLLEVVFLCAFYGFLSMGEFTTRNNKFDTSHDLTVSDITLDEHYFSILLKHSKSDKDLKGYPRRTNTDFCPFFSMSRYLGLRPHARPDEPLFITEESKAMSRSWLASRLRTACQSCGLSPELYTPHSFRIGAATTAASVTTIPTLKSLGRWSSTAYERYIRPGTKNMLNAQKAMDLL